MPISPPVTMKEYVPHFNEPFSFPPELSWNLKTDRRSVFAPFAVFPKISYHYY